MTESLQRVKPLLQDDRFGGNGSSSCEFLLFKVVEDILALLLVSVGEKQSTVTLQILNEWISTCAIL